MPVTVEYRLTPLGQTLTATLDALRVRAGTHIEEVLATQNRCDARAAAGSEP